MAVAAAAFRWLLTGSLYAAIILFIMFSPVVGVLRSYSVPSTLGFMPATSFATAILIAFSISSDSSLP